jgi:hypothetical protein
VVRSSGTRARTDNLPLFLGRPMLASIDLLKATKLKDVVFRPKSWSVKWITMALQTLTPKHRDVRHITIRVPYNLTVAGTDADIRRAVGETGYGQWLDLDHSLVQFWEARSICPKVVCTTGTRGEQGTRDFFGCLLPEITRRRIVVIDLAG